MNKKIICVLLLLVVAFNAFAARTIYGFYLSPYSLQSSKNLADKDRKPSVYGFGGKASCTWVFDSTPLTWSLGADAELSNYFYAKADHFDILSAAAFADAGLNILDTEKMYLDFNLGFGVTTNIVFGGNTKLFPALKFDLGAVQHLYDNVSIGVQVEGIVSFKRKSSSAFDLKTFAGIEYSF